MYKQFFFGLVSCTFLQGDIDQNTLDFISSQGSSDFSLLYKVSPCITIFGEVNVSTVFSKELCPMSEWKQSMEELFIFKGTVIKM